MLEFYHVVVQYDVNDALNFFRQVDLPNKPIKYVTFNFGDRSADMSIEDTTHDVDKDCIIHDLGVISDPQSTPEEIKDKMKGWSETLDEALAPKR